MIQIYSNIFKHIQTFSNTSKKSWHLQEYASVLQSSTRHVLVNFHVLPFPLSFGLGIFTRIETSVFDMLKKFIRKFIDLGSIRRDIWYNMVQLHPNDCQYLPISANAFFVFPQIDNPPLRFCSHTQLSTHELCVIWSRKWQGMQQGICLVMFKIN